jgi:hypothetical protein
MDDLGFVNSLCLFSNFLRRIIWDWIKKNWIGFMSKLSASHFYKINNFNKLKVFESHSAALLELYHTNVVVVVAVCCWYCLKLA